MPSALSLWRHRYLTMASSVISLWRHQFFHRDTISSLIMASSVISLWRHQSSLCENLPQCPGFTLLYTEVFQVSVYYLSLFCWVLCSFSVETEHTHTYSESAMIFQMLNPRVCITHLTKRLLGEKVFQLCHTRSYLKSFSYMSILDYYRARENRITHSHN